MTSIIILSFNTLSFTKLCIESFRRHATKGFCETIVMDTNSGDGSESVFPIPERC